MFKKLALGIVPFTGRVCASFFSISSNNREVEGSFDDGEGLFGCGARVSFSSALDEAIFPFTSFLKSIRSLMEGGGVCFLFRAFFAQKKQQRERNSSFFHSSTLLLSLLPRR
jgi:hypothetical protein